MLNMIWSSKELKSVELEGNIWFKLIKSFVSTFKVRKFGAKIPGTRDMFYEIRPAINSTRSTGCPRSLDQVSSNLLHERGQDFFDKQSAVGCSF